MGLTSSLPAAALTLRFNPALSSLLSFSFSFSFSFAWVLLRAVLRGLTSLGSQQPSERLRKRTLPGCISFLVSPASQVSPACYAQEDWAWAPDLHEVMREQEIPVCVRTSHRDCETSFTAITGRESRLGRQFLPFRGVLGARTPIAPNSARLFLPLDLSMSCPSIPPLGSSSHRYSPQDLGEDTAGFC